MLSEYYLDLSAELDYAKKWWDKRNPVFADFSGLGGDCTSFVSQCIYAGGAAMNYTPDYGWYFSSLGDRSAAWSGVEYFYRFIISNRGAGPFGHTVPVGEAEAGDVIQLCGENGCYHSLFVTGARGGDKYIAAHSTDAYDRPLSSYSYRAARCLRIRRARRYV